MSKILRIHHKKHLYKVWVTGKFPHPYSNPVLVLFEDEDYNGNPMYFVKYWSGDTEWAHQRLFYRPSLKNLCGLTHYIHSRFLQGDNFYDFWVLLVLILISAIMEYTLYDFYETTPYMTPPWRWMTE